ncbi:MAG: efflux RND transporter permease subunit, partial [Candidatus Hydrogenedentes bacterium]|nr:efflux RND transporter permease subunit [Candidatus Hydrogenedentota bacterium]
SVVYFMGYTLNMLTLLALTLSVGIVIDDAIVVLENIYRFIEEKRYSPREAVFAATKEIGLAVMTITMSLVAVFLPIAFMQGIVGQFMKSFGVTMASAILLSLFVSFTMAPMLASRWLKKAAAKNGNGANGVTPDEETSPEIIAAEHARAASKKRGAYHVVESGYLALLRFSLAHRWLVVLTAVLLLASVPLQFKYVAKDFVPDDDQSEFQMQVRAPEGTSMEATQLLAARIARDIRQLNGVSYTIATTADTEQHVPNLASIYVHMTEINQRSFSQVQLIDFVRKNVVPRYSAENLRVSIKAIDPIAGNSTDPGLYVVGGPDMNKLKEYAGKLMDRLKKVPGAVDVDSSLITGKPQYGVTINRDKADELGVSVNDIATSIRLLLAGNKVSDYNEGGEQYEVHVRALADSRNNLDLMEMVTLPSITGKAVPLRDVVRFTEGTGPAQINRLSRAREVTISANMAANASLQALIDALDDEAKSLNMGPEYKTMLVGKSKEMARTLQAFLAVFLMSFVIAYLVIAAQFESWLHPITVLLALPLTLPFALISLFIFNQSLNVFSILGMLVLFAVVKKNAILQIDHTIRLRAAGMSRYDAMIAANTDRLRPILMTTVAFVAGMFPLLLSSGAGAAINKTISSVVIGGQTLSLLLTLIATPVAYSLFDDLSNVFRKTKAPAA